MTLHWLRWPLPSIFSVFLLPPRWLCPNMWTTGTCQWRQITDMIHFMGLNCGIRSWILQRENQGWYSYSHDTYLKRTFPGRFRHSIHFLTHWPQCIPTATLVRFGWSFEDPEPGVMFQNLGYPFLQKSWHKNRKTPMEDPTNYIYIYLTTSNMNWW